MSPSPRLAYCSWCYRRTRHRLERTSRVGRDRYRCARCAQPTLRCRLCGDMARGRPDALPEAFAARMRGLFGDALCAEHDGSIASFETVAARLDDLADWQRLLRRRKRNVHHVARVVVGAAAGAALLAPLAALAAPGVAAGLGATGALGAASTGTAIQGLTGNALARASLAALGRGFGMRGGVAVLAAAGAALGAREGALVSHSYLGQVEGFAITRLREGRGPAVVVVDGFLTEKRADGRDWEAGLRAHFPENAWYHVSWESKRLHAIAGMAAGAGLKLALARAGGRLVGPLARKKPGLLTAATVLGGVARNPFHTAVVKASMTGAILADLLVRTRQPAGFVLLGHSLGARVVVSALEALATRERRIVRDAVLLGGAVGRGEAADWERVAGAVRGSVLNVWSRHDSVLRQLFPVAMPLRGRAIGAGPLGHGIEGIEDLDASAFVAGHAGYKEHLAELLRAAGLSRPRTPRERGAARAR